MSIEKKLVLEHSLDIDSGSILIADPCYVAGFDWKSFDKAHAWFSERLANAFLDNTKKILKTQIRLQDLRKMAFDSGIKVVSEALQTGKCDNEYDSFLKVSGEALAECEQIEIELKELLRGPKLLEPGLLAPYLFKGKNYVAFKTEGGDGPRPVIKWSNGLAVLVATDIEGTALGEANVDTGSLMVADANNFKIKPKIRPSSYCRLEVPNGVYQCRFSPKESNNYGEFLITRI